MSAKPAFDNFDLHMGPGTAGLYPVAVLSSPAGETATPVQVVMNLDDEPLPGWLRSLEEGYTDRQDLVALGRCLAGYMLPPGPVRNLYQTSLGITRERGLGLRIRLRIVPPELAALPWEYAYDDGIDDFLALNPRTVLVRYHSQPFPPAPVASRLPVPVLVMISNPGDSRPLDVVAEFENLCAALARLLDQEHLSADVLLTCEQEERRAIEALVAEQKGIRLLEAPASVDGLRDALRQGHRILHYLGHGAFVPGVGGGLLLDDGQGSATRAPAQTLARELRGSKVVVVVLNACQTATESTARSFMGLAPALIRAGIPAVVAMQYPILEQSAIQFSHALYKALADAWPLDAAVTEGRKAISARISEDSMEWGIPVLFMRSPDGTLWEEEPEEEREDTAPDIKAAEPPRPGITFYDRVVVHGDIVAGDKRTND